MHFGSKTRGDPPAASPYPYDHSNKEPDTTIVALDKFSLNATQSDRLFLHLSQRQLLPHEGLENQGQGGIRRTPPPGKPWRPLMLRRWVLVVFAILFALLIVSLEIILKISLERNGFGPTKSSLYYVWTYGPTAGESATHVIDG
jgi:hypothetical protein